MGHIGDEIVSFTAIVVAGKSLIRKCKSSDATALQALVKYPGFVTIKRVITDIYRKFYTRRVTVQVAADASIELNVELVLWIYNLLPPHTAHEEQRNNQAPTQDVS